MNTLVAWDDPKEADLLRLYLSLEDNETRVCSDPDEFLVRAADGPWDVFLMAQNYPTDDDAFGNFLRLRDRRPEVPVVLGCRTGDMFGLPRYLKQGLRSYVMRDERGDFLFLLMSSLESAVAAAQAERIALLAEKLREEMDGVRRLQEMIIPRAICSHTGYRTAARYEPSEVCVAGGRPVVLAGGDYYDVFPIDDHSLVLMVGDASGHGLRACMSIVTMHTLIRMVSADRYHDTAGFVQVINKWLCDSAVVRGGGGFITLFYALIDTQRHTMTWTSAGHPLALVHDRHTDEVRAVGGNADGGLPLGVSDEMGYDSATVELPPGCRVLVYSDGLADALAPPGGGAGAFGVRGIGETLRACRRRSLGATLKRLFRASQRFTGGEGRHDDTSVVLVERCGAA